MRVAIRFASYLAIQRAKRAALRRVFAGSWVAAVAVAPASAAAPQFEAPHVPELLRATARSAPAHAIFFHPDGYGLSHWNALRTLTKGPTGRLNWDRLPHMAVYTDNMRDALTASSHGGATTHAYGVKVASDSFGLDGHEKLTARSGQNMSIMQEAMRAGFAAALIQTGDLVEPGTAAFVASAKSRLMSAEIARQVIESGADVMLGGGERWLLPKGMQGRHGPGLRADGLNLIEKARQLGYAVVYTRDELLNLDAETPKVLGVFAHRHTFHDGSEGALRAKRLPHYLAEAPTIAEMSAATLRFLSRNPKAKEKGFFIVAEEEGTDNFGSAANARGSFEAGRRADDALGVFADFVEKNPNTFLLTAADSSAGGKYARDPVKGVDGSAAPPFVSAPDGRGNRLPFVVAWTTDLDLPGGVVARAKGLHAEKVSAMGVVDNTDIYRLLYYTLFRAWLP